MAKSDGSVIIDTRMDTSGFGKGVKSMKNQVNGLTSAVNKLGVAIGTAFAVKKIIQFGKEAIELGSDLQEVQNVVDVTFTTMSDKVNEFAQGAAEAAGLSETMAKKYVGTFGAMAKAFGFAEGEAFNMSTSLTQLAGDVASFYNITQDEAYTKLKSVFTGETETLKDLGVVMTQNALDSYAMAEGYGKTTKQMSEQEKVALRYSFVLDQLSAAQGDFVRTSDSWANQTRILSLNFNSFKANIGQALINIFTPFLKILNQIVSKMAELSKHFVAFSEMLVGKSTSGGGGSPGDALGEITGGYEDITDATEEATKAQKKYLSGLDEIRTYTPQQSKATTGGGGNISFPTIPEKEKEEVLETNSLMDKLIKRIKELQKLFLKGFKLGLGDTESRLKTLKDSIESIKNSFSYIADEDFFKGFNDSFDRVVFSLGQLAGAFASIGLTLASNLLGGFSGFLESEKENIKNYLLSMLDLSAGITEKAAEFVSAFAYIFQAFGEENGQKITEDLLGIFATAFMNITELAFQFGLDIMTLIVDPIVNSKEALKKGFDDMLLGISDFTGEIRRILNEAFELIWGIYEEHIQPIFERLIPELEQLWQEHVAPLLTEIGNFFSLVAENIGVLWNETLKPFIQWFSDNIMPVISPILESMGKLFIDVLGTIADVLGDFLDTLGGVITFITGVFTGDWERAWNGIVDIFTGIINICLDVFEGLINGVIALLNGLLGGVNFITGAVGIPEIPKIPELNIPRLATGAVIPPNAPFMAVLGDQKRGTNIEAPLDTIKQAVREVMGSGNVGGNGVLHNVIQINRRTLLDEMIDEAKLRQSTNGRNPFELV